jgi:hypothetical protein
LVYIGYGPAPAYKCVFQIPSYLALFPQSISGIAVLVGFVDGDLSGDLVNVYDGLTDELLDL